MPDVAFFLATSVAFAPGPDDRQVFALGRRVALRD
jgi:hypothetical protein